MGWWESKPSRQPKAQLVKDLFQQRIISDTPAGILILKSLVNLLLVVTLHPFLSFGLHLAQVSKHMMFTQM